ncbi:low affinity immunoglobulin epsilon Fc receptor [Drosophila santomea]|uniref:low affinity immunoglobulin epsilon Fc receptor n=1 Tax=Drosophila santomea TaxID=129105 RepID=UPI0019549B7F|nr:low affinity immunoglobulin epsilon Fc receptor [Drosophila santomea]
MFKLKHFIVYLLIACNLWESGTESTGNTRSVCLLQDPPNQCGEFCLLVLQPLLDHIAKHQEQWNTTEALRLNDTQFKLDRIQTQLAAQTLSLEDSAKKVPGDIKERLQRMENLQTTLQETLKKMPSELDERLTRMENQQKSIGGQLANQINLTIGHQGQLESLKNAVPINLEVRLAQIEEQQKLFTETLKKIPEDFEQRLERLEQHQKDELTKMATQQNAIQDTLSKIYIKVFWPEFERIGTRLFYINNNDAHDWNSAVEYCRKKGGYIAAIKDEEELDAISLKLNAKNYWLGINDQKDMHSYVSKASGKKITFFNWNKGEPNHGNSDERCVELFHNKMNDDPCSKKKYVICQTDNEV